MTGSGSEPQNKDHSLTKKGGEEGRRLFSPSAELNDRLNTYLALAQEIANKGMFPSPSAIAPKLGVSIQTVYKWQRDIPAFKMAVREILFQIEDQLVDIVNQAARTATGHRDRVLLLQRIAPERWRADQQAKEDADNKQLLDDLSKKIDKYIDAEVISDEEGDNKPTP